MSALRVSDGALSPATITSLADELAELARAQAVHGAELAPELVRLGAAWRTPDAHTGLGEAAPMLRTATLEEVTRIGAHLGRLEQAASELPEEDGLRIAGRLARVRVLVECAGALATLRAVAAAGLCAARPA